MPDHDLTLVYVPHLDYDLQRHGPDSDAGRAPAARDVDAVLTPLLDDAERAGATVVLLSEYGITKATRPVDVNRLLRREGLLHVHHNATGELLDPWTSRAFAVADHQVAHVYVKDPADVAHVRGPAARPRRRRRGARPRGPGGVRPRPRARRRAGAGGRARRVVHLLLLARRRQRARLRARRSRSTRSPATTPPSCSSTPRTRWVKARAGARPGQQEGRAALRHERGAARPGAGQRQPRPAAGPTRGGPGAASAPTRPSSADRVEATDVRDLLVQPRSPAPDIHRDPEEGHHGPTRSPCSPASGPTCRSRRSRASPPSGGTTASRSPAGATTSTRGRPPRTTPTSRASSTCWRSTA